MAGSVSKAQYGTCGVVLAEPLVCRAATIFNMVQRTIGCWEVVMPSNRQGNLALRAGITKKELEIGYFFLRDLRAKRDPIIIQYIVASRKGIDKAVA